MHTFTLHSADCSVAPRARALGPSPCLAQCVRGTENHSLGIETEKNYQADPVSKCLPQRLPRCSPRGWSKDPNFRREAHGSEGGEQSRASSPTLQSELWAAPVLSPPTRQEDDSAQALQGVPAKAPQGSELLGAVPVWTSQHGPRVE